MINKDSIVTAYDEHLTLVEWLQKVEKALNTSVLTNLGIAKLSDQNNVATYQVTATFADTTTIVSDTFTLPSTDIVTAFSNLTTLVNGFDTRITDNTNNVASILQNIDIDNAKINPDTLQNSINGSDDVIVDVDNDKLEIHLSDELLDTISTHTSTIATNTADIAKNTSAISSLDTRTKNLEDSKVNVNTGAFNPTSDNPAGQKSTMDAIVEVDLNARFSRVSSKNLSGAFGNLPAYYNGKFHLLRDTAFPWGADFDFTLLFAYTKVGEIDNSPSLNMVFEKAGSINMSQCFLSSNVQIISATYSLRNVNNLYGAFNMSSIKTIKLRDYPISFDISASTNFEESDLVEILNNLMDLTGKTSQTLTMGTTNLAKLTDAEKAIATNKNWTLA